MRGFSFQTLTWTAVKEEFIPQWEHFIFSREKGNGMEDDRTENLVKFLFV